MAASDYHGWTDAVKAQFVQDLSDEHKNPTDHVAQVLHRCFEWAGSTYPKGYTYEDVRWVAEQCVKELHKRDPKSKASMDGFPPASAGQEAAGPKKKKEHKSAAFDVEERCQALSAADKVVGEPRSSVDPDAQSRATEEDSVVTKLIAQATELLQKAKVAQANDPDNKTDPHDAEVWAHLEDSLDAVKEAAADQTKDDAERSSHAHAHDRAGYVPVAYHRQPGENVQCPRCEKWNDADAKYCDQCDFHLEGETVDGKQNYAAKTYHRGPNEDVWCPECAKCNADDAVFCDQCGYRLEGSDSVTIGKTEGMQSDSKPAPRSSVPAIPKRAFTSFTERSPAHEVHIEMRAGKGDDSTAGFLGYASTTGQGYGVTDWMGEYRETIMPGAFAKTLREQSNVPLLFNHDGWPLASTGSDTSFLSEDKNGLRNEAILDLQQPSGLEAYRCLMRGTLNKMSFSFRAVKDTWNDAYDDRSVNELALYDTSIVTYPANPNTTAELREAFQNSLGREGRSLFWSARSAFETVQRRHVLPIDAEPLVEKALRALFAADEEMARQFMGNGSYSRARTFLVANALAELRVGRVLSSGNETLLKQALDALGDASGAITKVLANNATDPAEDEDEENGNGNTNNQGLDGDLGGPGSPGNSGNPLMPTDGLGPRIGNTGPRSDRTPESVKRALAKIAAARAAR